MRFQGHTPLTSEQVGFESELRERLRNLWVESLEEYVSLLTAVDRSVAAKALDAPDSAFDGVRSYASKVLPAERMKGLVKRTAGGTLGRTVDPDHLATFKATGRVLSQRPAALMALAANLPPSVRLMDRMMAVRAQGDRGACVAFSSVALREFLAGAETALSEQFLYWACKEMDGYPGPGTSIATAMTALSEYGVCPGRIWPYNPIPFEDDEGQGPPPEGAIEAALEFRMLNTRPVQASRVEHYKRILAGDDDTPGMPVVIGTLVFSSWFYSPETHRTGKVTLPLPGEEPELGGHAWCIVGYHDDPSVPGGGYFIVRNSWGTEWGHESPEAPGHAVMPYEYVARYADEAFSGEVPSLSGGSRPRTPATETPVEVVPQIAEDDPLREYLWVIPKTLAPADRMCEGEELPPGTIVLRDPLDPQLFRRPTPENRDTFVRRQHTWSEGTRAQAWFPALQGVSEDTRAALESARAAHMRFRDTLETNLPEARKGAIPDVHLPFWTYLIPWAPKVRSADQVADLSVELFENLQALAGVPPEVPWDGAWTERWQALVSMQVHELRSAFSLGRVHIIVVFATPMRFHAHGDPDVLTPGTEVVATIRKTYETWRDREGHGDPAAAYMTAGAPTAWSEGVQPSAPGALWTCYSDPAPDGTWNLRRLSRAGEKQSVNRFLDYLEPVTWLSRVDGVKECVEELLVTHLGTLTIDLIAKRTGIRADIVRDALFTLQEQGGIVLEKLDDGRLQVARQSPEARPGLRAEQLRSPWWSRHVITVLGTGVMYSGWKLAGALSTKAWLGDGLIGFIVGILCIYFGSTMQSFVHRKFGNS